MTERPNLGQILTGVGRIDDDDVKRALDHQREHGGYFGEALLALNLLTKEELEWGLASQFDLPYIFPDADSVAPEAAMLVTPEWALAHLTMPILLTQDAVTVVVESPLRTAAVEELSARTDREIQLALASGERIRELIQQVYARGRVPADAMRQMPVSLDEAFSLALEAAAPRFGISVRRHRAWFWFDEEGTIQRRPLEGGWAAELDLLMAPPPSARIGTAAGRVSLDGQITRDGVVSPVEVECITSAGGQEYLFRPREEQSALHRRFPPPSAGVLAEIRLLARSGSVGFLVTSDPPALSGEIGPFLPSLLLDPTWRPVHLTATGEAPEGVFTVELPEAEDASRSEITRLRAFGFDAVTVDLGEVRGTLLDDVLDVAGVAFVVWSPDDDRRLAHEAGMRWHLHAARAEGGRLDWSLEPLRTS